MGPNRDLLGKIFLILCCNCFRYVVFVSKHLDGYSNWETDYNYNWNSVDVGPNRDLLGRIPFNENLTPSTL